jgi:outer membrane protein assembly factor BamB
MRYPPLIAYLLVAIASAAANGQDLSSDDWPMFGGNVESTSANPHPTGIRAANVAQLKRVQVRLDGTVDASVIFLHNVSIHGADHNAVFLTTTYGKTLALDARSGAVLWEFTPPSYAALAGSRQITNSTPAAAADRKFVYAASPDGNIQKLSVEDGQPVWRTEVTKLAQREKVASPIKVFAGHVIVVTAGYIGDRRPYQGHVAVLDEKSGQLLQVWNSLCSDRSGLIDPNSCPQSQSAIWGRAGAVIDSHSGSMLIATGNGPWNGTTDWGDALIEIDGGATKMLGNYTPENTAELESRDLDLGSTSPALLGADLIAQGGKDGKIRLLSRKILAGDAAHKDHELQTVSTPSGTDLFAQPAVWQHDGRTWMFAADNGGTAAWELKEGKLEQRWKNRTGGTSPFESDGLVFVYARAGGLNVYEAETGAQVATLECGPGHWSSPVVVAGEIFLPEGNANDHSTSGVLDIWSLGAEGTR